MKFIKIQNTIMKVAEIESIYTVNQYLVVKCKDASRSFVFSSQMEAKEELNRIYKHLEKL